MLATPTKPRATHWRPLVEMALAEDVGSGDVTTSVCVDTALRGRARVEAREDLVVCGQFVVDEVFRQVDAELSLERRFEDGARARAGDVLTSIEGRLASILVGERVALNFMARMSGIATHTRRFVDAVRGTRALVCDTRKTLPGWRALDKYSVAAGGGTQHRIGLFDGILIKDNHIAAAGGVSAAVKAALAGAPAHLRVQVEVQSETEAAAACEAGADFLLLDNCSPEQVARMVERFGERALLEASGGIGLDNVRAYAESGVHRVSVGGLTHSAPAVDVALEIEPGGAAR